MLSFTESADPSVCRRCQSHATAHTESGRSEIRALGGPLCVCRVKGQKEEGPALFRDPRVARSGLISAVFSCSEWPTSLPPEGVSLLMGLIDSSLLEVWAVNAAGKAPSRWTRCRTGPAPPEGLRAPAFHVVSPTQAVANISAPQKPNGIISLYRLFSKDTGGTQTLVSSRILIVLFETYNKPWCPGFLFP